MEACYYLLPAAHRPGATLVEQTHQNNVQALSKNSLLTKNANSNKKFLLRKFHPTIEFNIEDPHARISVMCFLEQKDGVWWFDSRYADSSSKGGVEKFQRRSLGIGYRKLMRSHIMLGAYGYLDRSTITLLSPIYSNFKTMSAGLEGNFFSWSCIANYYYSYDSRPDSNRYIDTTYYLNAYPEWGLDLKIQKNINTWKIGTGTFYTKFFPLAIARSYSLPHALPLYGIFFEVQCQGKFGVVKGKYSYDNFKTPRFSIGLQRAWYTPSKNVISSSLYNTVERHLSPALIDHFRNLGPLKLKVSEERGLTKKAAFCKAFIDKYRNRNFDLNEAENQLLNRFMQQKEIIRYYPDSLQIERQFGGDFYSFLISIDSQRNASRSVSLCDKQYKVECLLWLALLQKNQQSTINSIVQTTDRSRTRLFHPTQKQLSVINQFATMTTDYFHDATVQQLIKLEENYEKMVENREIFNGEFFTHLYCLQGTPRYIDYRSWWSPSALDSLHNLTEQYLKSFQNDLRQSDVTNLSHLVDQLSSIYQKQRNTIAQFIKVQRTALFLIDCPLKFRITLLCFSNMQLKEHANEPTIAMIAKLRLMPTEIKELILQHTLASIIENKNNRYRCVSFADKELRRTSVLWKERFFSFEKFEKHSQSSFIRFYARTLLPYLSTLDIKKVFEIPAMEPEPPSLLYDFDYNLFEVPLFNEE